MIELTDEKEFEFLETEHGTFTNNFVTNQTAREVYEVWLQNKDNITEVQPTEIEILQQENKILKGQVEALNHRADFYEDLIAEMAMKIYD